MPDIDILLAGTNGVDMLSDPITLSNQKAHFTKNFEHVEGRIQTRSDIVYEKLGIRGKFQGANYHTPRYGLLADNRSDNPTALVTVVDGNIYFTTIDCDGLSSTFKMRSSEYKGDTYTFSAEQYLIVVNKDGPTAWHNRGIRFTDSKGSDLCGSDETHDTLDYNKHKHFLLNNVEVGEYIHGRVALSRTEGCNTSFLYFSDLVTKRKHEENSELTLMEEQALEGEGLNVSAHMGKTIALAKMPTNSLNGEGTLLDFRERGVAEHETFNVRQVKRNYNGNGELTITEAGWQLSRVTNERLRLVSATGRYAVEQLPSDVLFGSQFGLHLYRRTLGEGSFNDERQNHISQDVQPLWLQDNYLMKGRAVGYWIEGNRFLATVGLNENDSTTSTNSRSFVVANKASTFSEDRTGKFLWEGMWEADDDISGIHKFTRYGHSIADDSYGFVASDNSSEIVLGEFTHNHTGYDYRGGERLPIEGAYISGFFVGSGLNNTDKIINGYLTYEANESTGDIEIYIRSDENKEWSLWKTITDRYESRKHKRRNLDAPSAAAEQGTYFQFRLKTTGFVRIKHWSAKYSIISENSTGQEVCTDILSTEENYYDY